MGFMEGVLRGVKRKFIQNLRKNKPNRGGWSERKLEKALKDVTESYNNTVSSSHGFTPSSVNFSWADPMVREALYGKQGKLQPFEDFYKEKLADHKLANTPAKASEKPNFDESKYQKNDLVFVDFRKTHIGTHSGSAYQVQRGKIYEIASVNVT